MKKTALFLALAFLPGVLVSGCGGTSKKTVAEIPSEAMEMPESTASSSSFSNSDEAPPMDAETAARLQEIDKICEEVPCRPDTDVQLMVDNDRFFESTVHGSPYVYDGLVSVLAGEEIHVEGNLDASGKVVDLHYVPAVVHPSRTITIAFAQTAEGRIHKSMIMKISSGFEGTIRYSAGIMPAGSTDVFGTSTCPIRSGVPVMEMWQDLLMSVHLTDFHIEDPNDPNAGACY